MPATVASAQSVGSGLADVSVERFGGADRYETSLRIAEAFAESAGGTVEDVVMVSGRHWTDAVVAASVASRLGAPLLMTPPGELRDDALEFLKKVGARRVAAIAAGEWPNSNIQPEVFFQIRDAGLELVWSNSVDRYTLGVEVARVLEPPGSLSPAGSSAIIANGEVFADALVAGPLSFKAQVPVLLTPRGALHPAVADYLRDADIAHVVLMGGTAALSEDVETAIRALGITEVDRMAGASRFETATMTAQYAAGKFASGTLEVGCFDGASVGLARARVPFDSLGAAPLLAQRCAPLVLTDPAEAPQSTADYLDNIRRNADGDIDLTVFGGNAAVSQDALDVYLDDSAMAPVADVNCDVELGTKPVVLLGGIEAQQPVWSADCSRIAYIGTNSALWTAKPDGSDRVRVTAGAARNREATGPTWSPDGTRIAFWRTDWEQEIGGEFAGNIFVAKADGTGETQLTDAVAIDSDPVWSPDGTRIAFARQNLDANVGDFDGGWGDGYIVVIDADGRNETELGRGGDSEALPSWSFDSEFIAYKSESDYWVMRPDGSDRRRLPLDYASGDRAAWSPAGYLLAIAESYSTVEDGVTKRHQEIVVVSLDGDSERVVVRRSGASDDRTVFFAPQWSPDGRSILYEVYDVHDVDGEAEGRYRAFLAAVER